MADYLTFGRQAKRLVLYDTFEGLPEKYASVAERDILNPDFALPGLRERVAQLFAPFRNVEVVQGIVPDVFPKGLPEKIAFLHLDLNSGPAEVAVLDQIFDRVTPGGLILLDDYGRQEHTALHTAHAHWFGQRGYMPLELPTGQGLVVRR